MAVHRVCVAAARRTGPGLVCEVFAPQNGLIACRLTWAKLQKAPLGSSSSGRPSWGCGGRWLQALAKAFEGIKPSSTMMPRKLNQDSCHWCRMTLSYQSLLCSHRIRWKVFYALISLPFPPPWYCRALFCAMQPCKNIWSYPKILIYYQHQIMKHMTKLINLHILQFSYTHLSLATFHWSKDYFLSIASSCVYVHICILPLQQNLAPLMFQ